MAFETGAIHAPQHLTDLCVSYAPRDDGYVRNVIFPRKEVPHETDLIAQISKADTLRLYDLDVSGRGEIPEVMYRTTSDLQYRCKPIAAKAELNPKDMQNADAAYRHEKRQTKQALVSAGIRMEHLAVNETCRQTATWSTGNFKTYSAATRWDAASSTTSTPLEDLQAAVATVRIKTGTSAGAKNRDGQGMIKVIMHEFTFMALKQHPNVLNRISFNPSGTGAILSKRILAEILEVGEDDIIVVSAQYTSSAQGPAVTAAFKGFIGSDVLVVMTDTDPENDQCVGHEFVFDGLAGEEPFLVTKWTEFGKGIYMQTNWVGVGVMADYKVTNPDAGFLLQGVINAADTTRYGNPTLID
jgi:hypothetical protein